MNNQVKSRLRSPFLFLVATLVVPTLARSSDEPLLVPQPQTIEIDGEREGLTTGGTISVVLPSALPEFREHFTAVSGCLSRIEGYDLQLDDRPSKAAEDAVLKVDLDPQFAEEQYAMKIDRNTVEIKVAGLRGLARATATLLQLLASEQNIPSMEVRDRPDCSYRSLMVDLGRNPHSLACLRETVDLLWFYKVDSLHLHLTDDQRFAFPSRAFPKLADQKGLITWKQFEALDHYARIRGIHIIPELDVPGHSGILRRAYPEIFGETSEQLARRPRSRQAIKKLLGEMIEVFPTSPYIHVGGDEAGGVPEDLQREFINDLHRYLASQGKQTVVWEGPRLGVGENKIDTDVIHINWRTINFPANEMLNAGYQVVNASWDPLYIVDHYPRNNFTMVAPRQIYEGLQLRRFKHVNPHIPTFSRPIVVPSSDKLLGFCMPWWEGREVNYFPLVFPRLIPMAEVAWHDLPERDYNFFSKRLAATEAIRQKLWRPIEINASPLVLEQEGVFDSSTEIILKASAEGEIRYTLDGSEPSSTSARYVEPFVLDQSATVRAAIFREDQQIGYGARRNLTKVQPAENLALAKPVVASVASGALHTPARLTDGGTGNLDFFLAYPAEPEPVQITIDLGEVTVFDRVVVHSYFNGNTHESHAVQVSDDGQQFHTVSESWDRPDEPGPATTHQFDEQRARYVRVLTKGCKGYVFDSFSKITEIQVFSDGPRPAAQASKVSLGRGEE